MGRKGTRLLTGVAVVAALVLVPFYAPQYTVSTLVRIIYFGFLALSVGLLIGQGGMISLTQTAFFGLAGYVVGLLGRRTGVAVSRARAERRGRRSRSCDDLRPRGHAHPSHRLSDDHPCPRPDLLVVRAPELLAAARVGGHPGDTSLPLAGIDFTQGSFFYWMALALFLAGLLVMALLVRSPFGLVLKGIRENPVRMKALGYPVYWVRVTVFIIAALYAGIGGIVAVYATGIVTPTTIQLSRTIWVLLVVILGGANYFWDPVVGTVIADLVDMIVSAVTPRYNTVIGIIFVAVVLLTPNGIMGLLDRMTRAVRAGRARRAAVERREGGDEST